MAYSLDLELIIFAGSLVAGLIGALAGLGGGVIVRAAAHRRLWCRHPLPVRSPQAGIKLREAAEDIRALAPPHRGGDDPARAGESSVSGPMDDGLHKDAKRPMADAISLPGCGVNRPVLAGKRPSLCSSYLGRARHPTSEHLLDQLAALQLILYWRGELPCKAIPNS